MSDLKGTNIASPIVPFTSDDTYATHEAKYGKGGFRTVQTIAERDNIPEPRREAGMLVYVIDDASGTHTYQYLGGLWVKSKIGSGIEKIPTEDEVLERNWEDGDVIFIESTKKLKIYKNSLWIPIATDIDSDTLGLQVYTNTKETELREKNLLPDEYFSVDSETEIEEKSNLQVLFSAIRSLQAEVSKLKASFSYGINSCTGTETAGSRILDELEDVTEEEPLWATQESELSGLFSLQFSSETELEPETDSTEINSYDTYIKINNGSAVFNYESIDETKRQDALLDPKVFLYLTLSKKTAKIELIDDNNETYTLDLNELLPSISSTYAILIVVSKKITDQLSGEKYGSSFVWITAQELVKNNTIFEKYIDPSTGKTSDSPVYLDDNYYLNKVILTNLSVSKFDLYTKYQDFSDKVSAVRPSDLEDIKYKATHITIRSVETIEILDSIITKLQNNELVYVTGVNSLYIIYDGKKHKIGAGSSTSEEIDTMTVEELITNLTEQGLINLIDPVYDDTGKLTGVSNIELSKISALSLVNEHSGDTITYSVDSEGNLKGNKETPENLKFSYIVAGNKEGTVVGDITGDLGNLAYIDSTETDNYTTNRGFIARIHGDNFSGSSSDIGLKSDRVKIGAFYAPIYGAETHGCTHSYIELENSSQTDYYLDGCYLHYAGAILGTAADGSIHATQATYHVELSGIIPAGGTYLVRGFNHASVESPTAYIKVNSFDKEWYVTVDSVTFTAESGVDYSDNYGKLLSLDTIPSTITGASSIIYGLALTYGLSGLKHDTRLISANSTGDDTFLSVLPCLIDSLNFFIGSASGNACWNALKSTGKIAIIGTNPGNCIFKNTFELDPAKQAFQSYSKKDSSRLRGVTAADNMIVELKKEYIQLPNSKDTLPVSVFTPKASFEGKNVCTDKTQLDTEKPNMVTVSFGIDQTTTRCFNWISVGDYDEYVWIRKSGSTDWTRIGSYWQSSSTVSSSEFSRKEFNQVITYNTSETKTVREIVYANSKNKNVFPGCKVSYTSHKCIINITTGTITEKTKYEYLVGRSNSDGTPMDNHVSSIQSFYIYPSNYTPVIYQISDQQGFHWLEYQAWAAAAEVINKKIESDLLTNSNIIPILLNTGDMTQNGTRINEWLDYYRAGECLFDHLEQVNCVGNNDLGNVDETALGTGDDPGKANPHFYNQCYCYEIPIVDFDSEKYLPIFTGAFGPTYIPSMFYCDFGSFRLFVGNTELTTTAGNKLFGTETEDIYTGLKWTTALSGGDNTSDLTADYVTIASAQIDSVQCNHYLYEVLYAWMNNGQSNSKKMVFACHEMPFTVVTLDNLGNSFAYSDRSVSVTGDSTGLIGSHCNRPNYIKSSKQLAADMKIRSKGTYWLSRLLENFGIQYCLGGHKHTYACTWPLRENYYYLSEGNYVSSITNGRMTMPKSLKDDTVCFLQDKTKTEISEKVVVATSGKETMNLSDASYASDYENLTKFPIINSKNFNSSGDTLVIKGNYAGSGDYINSSVPDQAENQNYVVYFMLQATGFKLKSNKELPGTLQKFSVIIPKTESSKPSKNQIYPMFAKIILNGDKYSSGLDINLMAIKNIVPNNQTEVLNQQSAYSSSYTCSETPVITYFDNTGEESISIPYGNSSSSSGYGDQCWNEVEKTIKLHL